MDVSPPSGPSHAALHAEVAASGGDWPAVLRAAAAERQVDLGTVTGPASPADDRWLDAYVDAPRGTLSVALGTARPVFLLRMWWTGAGEVSGRTHDLGAVIEIARAWRTGVPIGELCARWPFLEADELTLSHDRGEAVAHKWRLVRGMSEDLIDREIVEAAYAHPRLRSLFPLVSHGSLQFSRCTHFPWTYDVPSLHPQFGGGWGVWGGPHGRDVPDHPARTAREAVELVVAYLPDGCGPAVEGPAELLRG